MSISTTFPVTGGAQTGFTSPTYSGVPDRAPTNEGTQWAITAIGGTQAGVTTHTASNPFTLTFVRPKALKRLNATSNSTSVLAAVPMNRYKIHTRKGVKVLDNQPVQIATINVEINIPAGSDVADAANLRALVSLAVGSLNHWSAGLGDTVVTGIV